MKNDVDELAAAALARRPFSVGETLNLLNPAVGVPAVVNYRGKTGAGSAVVVLRGIQMVVDLSWLSRSPSTSADDLLLSDWIAVAVHTKQQASRLQVAALWRRLTRAHMADTGESYCEARGHVKALIDADVKAWLLRISGEVKQTGETHVNPFSDEYAETHNVVETVRAQRAVILEALRTAPATCYTTPTGCRVLVLEGRFAVTDKLARVRFSECFYSMIELGVIVPTGELYIVTPCYEAATSQPPKVPA